MKPRHEQMHENRHHRHAGPFDGGRRKPEPSKRDLAAEYGWLLEDYDPETGQPTEEEEGDPWEGIFNHLYPDPACPHCGRVGISRTTQCRGGHVPLNHSRNAAECCPVDEEDELDEEDRRVRGPYNEGE